MIREIQEDGVKGIIKIEGGQMIICKGKTQPKSFELQEGVTRTVLKRMVAGQSPAQKSGAKK